jgi:hypothetical protein
MALACEIADNDPFTLRMVWLLNVRGRQRWKDFRLSRTSLVVATGSLSFLP